MKLSFILPTNRSKDRSEVIVENIRTVWKKYDIEIIICSPENFEIPGVVWLKDDTEQNGSVKPINMGIKLMTGEYYVGVTDDMLFDDGSDRIIDFLESPIFNNRKFKVACFPVQTNYPILSPNYDYPMISIAHYPVIHKTVIDNYFGGYVFNPRFHHHCVDHWIAYWMYKNGEQIIEPKRMVPCIKNYRSESKRDQDEHDANVLFSLIDDYEKGISTSY